jgi:hypothetical protein
MRPIRNANDHYHRNSLAEQFYPLSELPLYAVGNCYLLSGDLVLLLAQGLELGLLQPVGSLEDVSIALWLMAMQVKRYPPILLG